MNKQGSQKSSVKSRMETRGQRKETRRRKIEESRTEVQGNRGKREAEERQGDRGK